MWKQFRSAMSVWLGWFGVVVGALSVISVVVRSFDVGLRPLLGDFISFYHKLLMPLHDLIKRLPLPFEVTPSMVEIIIAYGALLGLSVRAEFTKSRWLILEGEDSTGEGRIFLDNVLRVVTTAMLRPVLTIQPVFDLVILHRRTRLHLTRIYPMEGEVWEPSPPDPEEVEERQRFMASGIQTLAMFVAFPLAIVVFFLLNAYS